MSHQHYHHGFHHRQPHALHHAAAYHPGLIGVFGGLINLTTSALMGGARVIRTIVEGSVWHSCHMGGHHGHHGCSCCQPHHYYHVECHPPVYRGHCCCH